MKQQKIVFNLFMSFVLLLSFNFSKAKHDGTPTVPEKKQKKELAYDSLLFSSLKKAPKHLSNNEFMAGIIANSVIQSWPEKEEKEIGKKEVYIPLGINETERFTPDVMFQRSLAWQKQSPLLNDNWKAKGDSTITWQPDSVYIERIQQISSAISLAYNEDVRRYIDRYTRKYSVITVQKLTGRAKYYFPIFEEVLDSYNIPLELKYLPIIESHLNPVAVSPARATGLWQFIYSTGRMYGMEVNSLVDERSDPLKSSHAAAQYLNNLYTRYNDWTLALAAYNCGPGNVNRAIKRAGGNTDYWEIMQYLPRETRNYVPAYIATMYIMNFHKEHNIQSLETDFPIVSDTVMVKKQVHFKQLSEVLGIPVEELQVLNPQYKRDIVPSSDEKKYALRLPQKYIMDFINQEDSIYNWSEKEIKEKKVIAQKYSKKPVNTKKKNGYLYYTIRKGDSFWNIAQKFSGVSYKDIMRINNMTANSRINPGDVIKIKKI